MSSTLITNVTIRRVHGKELRVALGFHSERSFQRARQAGAIGLTFYPLPSPSRGVYARSDDLERYLKGHCPESNGSKERAP